MIRILTESASDILPAEAEQLGVTVIPLNVTLEDGSMSDAESVRIRIIKYLRISGKNKFKSCFPTLCNKTSGNIIPESTGKSQLPERKLLRPSAKYLRKSRCL